MHSANHRGFGVAHRPLLQFSILFHGIFVKIRKYLTIVMVGQNRSLVDDAFGFEDIPFVAMKPVNASLHSLLDYELLNYEIAFTPLLEKVGDELVFAEIDSDSGITHVFFYYFQSVLRRDNSF